MSIEGGNGGSPPAALDPYLPPGAVVAVPADGQSVFRLLGRSETPKLGNFVSDKERPRPRAPDQDYLDYLGLSVFGSDRAALANATRFPKIVAELELQEGHGLMVARTYAEVHNHYTVWGDPEALLASVVNVIRLDEPG